MRETPSSPKRKTAQINIDNQPVNQYSLWDRTQPGASMSEVYSAGSDGVCRNNPNLNGFALPSLGASVPIRICQDAFPKWLADFKAGTTITSYRSTAQPPTVNVEDLRKLFSAAFLHERPHTIAFLNTPVLSVCKLNLRAGTNVHQGDQTPARVWTASIDYIRSIPDCAAFYWASVKNELGTLIALLQWKDVFAWKNFQSSIGFRLMTAFLTPGCLNRALPITLPDDVTSGDIAEMVSIRSRPTNPRRTSLRPGPSLRPTLKKQMILGG